jgi:phytoene dehydrogenase-like protein
MHPATADPTDHPTTAPGVPTAPAHQAGTVVVGAGIGGLLAAVTAARAVPRSRVVLLDPHPPGGRARCDDRGGFRFNRGPRAIYRNGPAEQALRAVGVRTTSGGRPDVSDALALHGGTTHRFPSGPGSALRTTLFTAKEKAQVARATAALWRAGADTTDGRSVADWLDHRSLHGTVRQFIEALVRVATYADAPEAFAAGPALASARAGIRPGVRYLDGGWQSLVDQLVAAAEASGVELVRTQVRAIEPGPAGATVVVDGGRWQAPSTVIAVGPPDAAAALLPGRPASWDRLAPPVTAACLELGIRGLPAHRFALGIDEPVYGSTHAPPADLAPDGHAVVHLMRYQPADDDQPASAQRTRLHDVAARMGIAPEAIVEERFLARMVVAGTLPHPATGGLAGRPPVAVAEHPGVFVAGDWVGPTGLLLDAAAASAVEAGQLAAARAGTMVPA